MNDKNLYRITTGFVEHKRLFSHVLSECEYVETYLQTKRKDLIGIVFTGREDSLPMNWLGQTEHLKNQNEVENGHCAEITRILTKECILKR
ncbi:hypothetical protein AB9N12_16370 [Bacteroides sp. AN502(2024)]|uniref:hypothetical protein n=1 Tax=Bacteroides sp. AN502(2024) TaxID=3160599 RepID=UPI00351216CE